MRSLEGLHLTSEETTQTDMGVPGRSVATRIMVLEEHPLLRDGMTDFLNAQPDMMICGVADNIRDARNEIAKSKPQLVVTALRLGTGDSLEFVKALKAEKPALLILVYSAFEEAIFAERTLRAGADGYVMKTAPKEEFLAAIRDVLGGNIYVSRDVAMRAFKKSLESRPDSRSAAPSAIGIEKLSDREMHIFNLLGSGLGNTQIAHSLHLSVKTIESHRENIKRKLDLSCSRDLVACAKKYVEETFLPAAKGAFAIRAKKKVVRFPAA
ncbi:MAG TPA: response regulator transcription factor [Candidatus Udaeobacter sp.]|jgi:DNA-binding NarL/FixJ family response regulator